MHTRHLIVSFVAVLGLWFGMSRATSQAEEVVPKKKGHVQADTKFVPTDVPSRLRVTNPESLGAVAGQWLLGVDHYILDDLKAGVDGRAPLTPYRFLEGGPGWSTVERVVQVPLPNGLLWPLPATAPVAVGDLVITFEEGRVRQALAEIVATDGPLVQAVLLTLDGNGAPVQLAPGTFSPIRGASDFGAPVMWDDRGRPRWGLYLTTGAGGGALVLEGEQHLAMAEGTKAWNYERNPTVGQSVWVGDGVLVVEGTVVAVDGAYVTAEFLPASSSKKSPKPKVQVRLPKLRVAPR